MIGIAQGTFCDLGSAPGSAVAIGRGECRTTSSAPGARCPAMIRKLNLTEIVLARLRPSFVVVLQHMEPAVHQITAIEVEWGTLIAVAQSSAAYGVDGSSPWGDVRARSRARGIVWHDPCRTSMHEPNPPSPRGFKITLWEPVLHSIAGSDGASIHPKHCRNWSCNRWNPHLPAI